MAEARPHAIFTFQEALHYAREKSGFAEQKIHPLKLNKHKLVKLAFNNYISILEDLHDQSNNDEDWNYRSQQSGGSSLVQLASQ